MPQTMSVGQHQQDLMKRLKHEGTCIPNTINPIRKASGFENVETARPETSPVVCVSAALILGPSHSDSQKLLYKLSI